MHSAYFKDTTITTIAKRLFLDSCKDDWILKGYSMADQTLIRGYNGRDLARTRPTCLMDR